MESNLPISHMKHNLKRCRGSIKWIPGLNDMTIIMITIVIDITPVKGGCFIKTYML